MSDSPDWFTELEHGPPPLPRKGVWRMHTYSGSQSSGGEDDYWYVLTDSGGKLPDALVAWKAMYWEEWSPQDAGREEDPDVTSLGMVWSCEQVSLSELRRQLDQYPDTRVVLQTAAGAMPVELDDLPAFESEVQPDPRGGE